MRHVFIFLIRLVSGAFRALGLRACRFYPSCSDYAAGAFERFGFFKALWLSVERVSSCHPFSEGGYKPLAE